MISVYVEKKNINNNEITIDNKTDINHILNVYRLKLNDEIRVVDGENEYIGNIVEILKKKIKLLIKEKKKICIHYL